MSDLATRLLDEYAPLAAERTQQEERWDELGAVCFPASGSISSSRHPIAGSQPDRARVAMNYDGTAMRSCNILATGQASRITPMGARWMVLRPPSHLAGNQQALNWYARCTEILALKLSQSNFYNRAFECYQQRGGYGISALEVTSGTAGRGLHFRAIPVGTFAVAENSLDEIDTIFREYFRTPAQMAHQYGYDQLPKDTKAKFDDAATRHKKTEKILHCIRPRQDRDPRRMDGANKPIASIHIHTDLRTILFESGFDSCPVAVSRWQTHPLNPYGWGPGDYALPEAYQANFAEQLIDYVAEKLANPPILYPAGMKDDIAFGPGGMTSFDPQLPADAQPREWMTGARYDVAKDRAEAKKKAIESAFFTSLFNAISQLPADATATQVNAIVSESRELFHPIYSNMVREFHTPVLRRCFSMLLSQGEMPPPPPSVIGQDELGRFIADPDVEYISAMAMALEQTHLSRFAEILSILQPLAALDPTWLRALDPESIPAHLIRSAGLPVTAFLRTPEQLAAIAQQEQQAAAAQQAANATQAVRNLGGVDETAKAVSMISQ